MASGIAVTTIQKKYTIGNGYIEESSMLKRKKLIAYVDISEAEIKQGDNVTYILLFDKRSKRPIIKNKHVL